MGIIVSNIVGLRYVPNYLTQYQHDWLLEVIDRQPWITDLKRRVQHYGYRYDYSKAAPPSKLYLGELPIWLAKLATKLHADRMINRVPDQVIINEYEPGQGIGSHTDSLAFGDTVLSISLSSTCVMNFTHLESGETANQLLEPRSLLILKGAARYDWKHAIARVKVDQYDGQTLPRGRRVSLTFRTVLK